MPTCARELGARPATRAGLAACWDRGLPMAARNLAITVAGADGHVRSDAADAIGTLPAPRPPRSLELTTVSEILGARHRSVTASQLAVGPPLTDGRIGAAENGAHSRRRVASYFDLKKSSPGVAVPELGVSGREDGLNPLG